MDGHCYFSDVIWIFTTYMFFWPFPDEIFLSAAQALADMVTEQDLQVGRMYPPLSSLKDCSIKIALKIMEEGYLDGIATTYPKPKDMETFIKNQLYNYDYENSFAFAPTYKWNI